MATSLLFLEKAFATKSPKQMAWSVLLLLLAVYTHSSAFWFALALGAYGLVRLFTERPPRRFVGTWLLGQAAVAGICLLVLFTQLVHMRGTMTETFARESWLRSAYFHPGEDNLVFFPLRQTAAVFKYLYSLPVDGLIMMLGFLGGAAWLLVKGRPDGKGTPARRDLGLLLLLPFAVACTAGIAGVYPYGGSRHSIFLFLFAAAGAAFLVTRVARRRVWPILVTAAVLVPVWVARAVPPEGQPPPRGQRRQLVANAVGHIRESVPKDRIIFTDILNQFMLRRYLSMDVTPEVEAPAPKFAEYRVAGYRLVASMKFFNFPADSFGDEFARMASAYGLEPGDTVCVASMGWGSNVAWRLYKRYQLEFKGTQVFSENIAVMQIPVGQEPSEANLAHRNEKASRALRLLARTLTGRLPEKAVAALWPSDLFDDSVPRLIAPLAEAATPYQKVYEEVQNGASFDRLLPALAFWQMQTTEIHPEFMSYMNDAEHYISGSYRFTLEALSPDSSAAVYLIQPAEAQPPTPLR
jgi:hypothetical protein